MADTLDDGEFWLPPQFLADDDNTFYQKSSATNKNTNPTSLSSSNAVQFGSFGGFSDFSTPNESLKSSSETESDEEDCLAGLTLRMARSTIDDGFDSDNPKARGFSGSPQSTLCDMGSGSGCSQGSSRGSPKGNCKVPSPPATWDLLHAAAGEVARMRMNDSHGVRQVSVPVNNSISAAVYYQKLQAMQHFQHLQQHRQMVQNRVRGSRRLTSPAWLPPTPQQASEMRAMFLGTQGGKRECAGTGVFLPRHTGNQSEPRKKPACSTVLVPARVMQALNLNLNDICSQPHLQPVAGGRLNSEDDVLLKLQINRGANYQKRIINNNNRRLSPTEHEIKLPQEWTY